MYCFKKYLTKMRVACFVFAGAMLMISGAQADPYGRFADITTTLRLFLAGDPSVYIDVPATHNTTCTGVDLVPSFSTPLTRNLPLGENDGDAMFTRREVKSEGNPFDGSTNDELEVAEGCLGDFGTRYLVRFNSSIGNFGSEDFDIGDPANPNPPYEDLFHFYAPHGHIHGDLYVFRLVDPISGEVAISRKYSTATLDTSPISQQSGPPKFFGFLGGGGEGISSGWWDDYPNILQCNYLDVTDVEPGEYVLEIIADGENAVPECDETNNVVSQLVVVPEQHPSNYHYDIQSHMLEYDERTFRRLGLQ